MTRTRTLLGAATVLGAALSTLPFAWRATPVAAQEDECSVARCDLQDEIDDACGPCGEATRHGRYVKCVTKVVKHSGVPKRCRGAIIRCAAKSTCGKGGVPCVNAKGKCQIADSESDCTSHGGTVQPGNSCCPPCASQVQCCVPSGSPAGAFTCQLLSPDACTGEGGTNRGEGDCSPDPCAAGTSSTTTTTTPGATTTTTQPGSTQCCVTGSATGGFTSKEGPPGPSPGLPETCVVTSPSDCATRGGRDVGPGTCSPDPCNATTTTTMVGATTTTIVGGTTTTIVGATTTTIPGGGCCAAARIETTSSQGTLEVSTLPAFPFPPNVLTVIEAGAADAGCKHNGIVPAGGFSVPTFCIPALGFSSDVMPTGCEAGGADGAAMVWDAAATAPDPDVVSVGDTSDPDGNNCGTLGSGCTTAAGGAGGDTAGNVNTTRGGAPHSGGSVHTQVDIPVHSITWVDADGACPDADGQFDAGADTLITEFDFILSPTTGHTSATFTDLNGDACAKAGNGPNSKSGDGTPATGPCCEVGQATTVAATATAFTGGAPLYDITFKSITPTTISACAAPSSAATCTLTTDSCKQ